MAVFLFLSAVVGMRRQNTRRNPPIVHMSWSLFGCSDVVIIVFVFLVAFLVVALFDLFPSAAFDVCARGIFPFSRLKKACASFHSNRVLRMVFCFVRLSMFYLS